MRARLQLFSAVLHAQHACAMVLSLSLSLSLSPFYGENFVAIANVHRKCRCDGFSSAAAVPSLLSPACATTPRTYPTRPSYPIKNREGASVSVQTELR